MWTTASGEGRRPPPPPAVVVRTLAGLTRRDERAVAVEQLMREADEGGQGEWMMSSYNVDDRGAVREGVYTMCYHRLLRPELREFCGPDWTFVHWPSAGVRSFEDAAAEIDAASRRPPEKPGVAGWIGNVRIAELPRVDETVRERVTRPRLLELAEGELRGKLEVTAVPSSPSSVSSEDSARFVPMTDLVARYGALVDIGGVGYSGRLKYLLFSGRPLLLVERDYVEYFHDDLRPFVHFVPVSADLSDLGRRIDWVREHPREAAEIAENAQRFAREAFAYPRLLERVRAVARRLGPKRSTTPVV